MKSLPALLLAATALLPTTALARPSARLTVERDPSAAGCAGEGELRQAVLERLGYDALRRDAEAAIDVRFTTNEAGGFSARVSTRDRNQTPAGERILRDDGSACSDLVEAVVLTICVILESPRPPKLAASPPTPRNPPTDVGVTPPEHAEPSPGRTRLRLRGEGTLGVGIAPSPAPGFAVAAGVRRGAFGIDLEGRADAPSEGSISDGRVETSVRMVQVVPCSHVGAFAGCLVAGVGAASIGGVDVNNARSEARFHATGGLRLAVEVPIERGFFFAAHADGLVAMTRTTARIGERDVYAMPPVGVLFGAGIGYAFP